MRIGFILFPNLTQLDFTGPLQVLHRVPGASTVLVAKTRAPVRSDCELDLVPTTTFSDCGPIDLLCVPGGLGVEDAIRDDETLAFIEDQGRRARWVTSVCTGAFLLGAAGLLRERRATTHWAYHHLLPLVGATPVQTRVVRDGNVVTGAGVTAGIDFALTIAAEVAGEAIARSIELAIEYDPAPPFDGGHPARARLETVDGLRSRYTQRLAQLKQVLQEHAPRH